MKLVGGRIKVGGGGEGRHKDVEEPRADREAMFQLKANVP